MSIHFKETKVRLADMTHGQDIDLVVNYDQQDRYIIIF
jgi:hypothetical protein